MAKSSSNQHFQFRPVPLQPPVGPKSPNQEEYEKYLTCYRVYLRALQALKREFWEESHRVRSAEGHEKFVWTFDKKEVDDTRLVWKSYEVKTKKGEPTIKLKKVPELRVKEVITTGVNPSGRYFRPQAEVRIPTTESEEAAQAKAAARLALKRSKRAARRKTARVNAAKQKAELAKATLQRVSAEVRTAKLLKKGSASTPKAKAGTSVPAGAIKSDVHAPTIKKPNRKARRAHLQRRSGAEAGPQGSVAEV